jgi:GDP-mannose 6-dehydrogenase
VLDAKTNAVRVTNPAAATAFEQPQTLPKPSISVVGLGYVGAVSCACLSGLGHRVVGVDIDPAKTELIAAGKSPIHEEHLEHYLQDGVQKNLLTATSDLAQAVAETDVTFVSVGTPTAEDGSCDTRYIEAAAREIGKGLTQKEAFHIVVMRCSIPPGATLEVMVPIIEEVSGKDAGIGFGVAFNPEFLREGVAMDDFHNPPKTVIGASDSETASVVSQIFLPVDNKPIITTIRVAEMVKYVDNVWHAAKVCFANEIGRMSKAVGVDGRSVMDIFVQDEKLNLSPYYLKPGFAYGGSCLPKEVRAMSYLAQAHGLQLPMIEGLQTSNETHIAEATRMVRETGAKKVAILGLAFKSGTDDLRESPVLEVMAALAEDGVELTAHDNAITADTQIEAQLGYVKHGSKGLGTLSTGLRDMLKPDPETALDGVDTVVVTHACPQYRTILANRPDLKVVDVVRLFKHAKPMPNYQGIGW